MPTILLVDDDRAILSTLTLIFRASGYCCVAACDFEGAERAFARDRIHLVILDHGLPGINGTSLAAHLKKIRDVPVLMLSGDVELCQPPSVDLLLVKPQPPKKLLAAVAQLLRTEHNLEMRSNDDG